MSLTDTTDASQSESIRFELDLAHSPAKVWRALSDPELLAQWLLPAIGFRLESGAPFTFRANPQPGWDGTVNCRIIEVEVGNKLSYGWVVGEMETVVTFTLTASATGTHLTLVQSGFKPHQKQNFGGARFGWRMMGGKLGDVLASLS